MVVSGGHRRASSGGSGGEPGGGDAWGGAEEDVCEAERADATGPLAERDQRHGEQQDGDGDRGGGAHLIRSCHLRAE
jgi:hypothetical protein